MAIRFACPSCRQPIEVDDQWGGQAVACPYCRRVVSAPNESTWPPEEVPIASPARTGFPSPPPPPGQSPMAPSGGAYLSSPHAASASSGIATWALVLAVVSGILSLVGFMIWMFTLVNLAVGQVGEQAAPEQIQQTVQEIMVSGQAPISPAAVTALLVGVFCGIAGLVLALRSLVRNENQYIRAGAACLLSALFIVCQGMLILALFASRAPGN